MDALRAAVADVAMEEVMDLCHAMVDKLWEKRKVSGENDEGNV